VQQGSVKASKTRGIFGRLLQMAFDFSNPSAASLRTSKDISAWGCPTSSKTWQEWVIERRGAYSARLNAERHTNASGCSSWPTVRHGESWQGHGATQSYAENGANHQVNYRYNKQGEKISIPKGTFDTTLTTAVIAQNWPSPVASEVRQGFQDRSRGMKGSQESLTTVVIKQHGPAVPASSSTPGSRPESWATPRAGKTTDENPETWAKRQAKGDVATMPLTAQVKQWQTATVSTGANRQKDGSMTDKLDQQVKNWATPRAEMDSGAHNGIPDTLHSQMKAWATPQSRDGKGAEGRMIRDGKSTDLQSQTEVEQTGLWNRNNGKLNPRWVETLMGLPVGWTMPSCASPVTIERMNSDSSVTVLSQQQQNEPLEA
jgi:hypothetical protein